MIDRSTQWIKHANSNINLIWFTHLQRYIYIYAFSVHFKKRTPHFIFRPFVNNDVSVCGGTVAWVDDGISVLIRLVKSTETALIIMMIIIITILIGAFISIFPNQFKTPQGWILWSLLPMGANLMGKSLPYYYIYCTEVHLSFCNDMNEKFENAGEWTFT